MNTYENRSPGSFLKITALSGSNKTGTSLLQMSAHFLKKISETFCLVGIVSGISILMLKPIPAVAVGFRLPNQDPEAISRGNAFAATADNPSAIYYNPAGITQLKGNNARVGVYFISADSEYTSPTGAKAKTDSSLQPVPQLYYVYSPESFPLAFGLGVYAPYGLALDWGKNTSFSSLAESGKLLFATVNPVVAWRINSSLSIAIGPTINYSQATLKQGLYGVPGGEFKFDGDGTGYSFNAGIRWQPSEMWAFGLNYRYTTTVDYNGNSDTKPSPPLPSSKSTHGSILFPQFVAGGISFRPTENWNIELDADWTDWDSVDQIMFHHTAFGDIPFPLDYRSSWMYEFGITRQLGKGYFVSTGYIYSENSSPDRHFNPIIPDMNLHLGSVGFGHRGTRWDWAIAYHFAYGTREVRNSVSATPETADGSYRTFNNAFNISATYKF
jgi:long-chain fatty acid transport protein